MSELAGITATHEQITEAAQTVWQLQPGQLWEKTNKNYITEPRHVVLYHMVRKLKIKPSKIADTTGFSKMAITGAVNNMGRILRANPVLLARYELFVRKLKRIDNENETL